MIEKSMYADDRQGDAVTPMDAVPVDAHVIQAEVVQAHVVTPQGGILHTPVMTPMTYVRCWNASMLEPLSLSISHTRTYIHTHIIIVREEVTG